MISVRIRALQRAVLDRPRVVLACAALLTVIAVLLAMQVELRTSRRDMVAPGDPDQTRYDTLRADFTGPDPLILGVEFETPSKRRALESVSPVPDTDAETSLPEDAATPLLDEAERLRGFVDRLAADLEASPQVDNVFYKIDVDWLAQNMIYLAPPEQIEQLTRQFGRMLPARSPATRSGSPGTGAQSQRATAWSGWADINEMLASSISANLDDPGALAGGSEKAASSLQRLTQLIAAERRFLEHPESFVAQLAPDLISMLGAADPRIASKGFLSTYDGSLLFLIVAPAESLDETLESNLALVTAVREIVDAHLAHEDAHGIRVSSTGNPALIVDEMQSIRSDTLFTSIVAIVGVTLLALLAFRWRSHAIVALAALFFGVVWAFGAVTLEIGYLNVITSSFVSTLIGVGIAYAIHPISEYELEGAHLKNPKAAVLNAYHHTGAAVLVSGLTTAGAFFAILLMDFQGFAELGLIAGVGVLLCLLSALVLLPVLLSVYGTWRKQSGRPEKSDVKLAAVDRLWVDQASRLICRWPRRTTALALLVTAGLAYAATGVQMNTDILDLLPHDSESKSLFERMTQNSNLTPRVNLVATGSLEELRAVVASATDKPEIARVESVLGLLPVDPQRSVQAARTLAQLNESIRLVPAQATDPQRLAASLRELETALTAAVDAAFVGGQADLVDPLDAARAEAEQTAELAEDADAETVARWSRGERELIELARGWQSQLAQATAATPPTLDTLPEVIKKRLTTRSGQLVALVYPSGNIFDPEFLSAFNRASKQISDQATGFPVMFEKVSTRITDGFYVALVAGAAIVFFLLLIDFRSLVYAAMAMIPLALGVIWMLGGMRLLGIDFNLANLVALPLVLGVGIDNGVHVVHRLKLEGKEGMTTVLRHTGRAILIASLTTMVGFGSLSLASHRGLASLGQVLLVGVGACLITSTIVLPNVLIACGWTRR